MAMNTFPMFINVADRDVFVLGGGEQAAQKTRLLLKTNAQITVFALGLEDELAALEQKKAITWKAGAIAPSDLEPATLVFIASGCPGSDAALHDLAKQADRVVNVVDQPHLCDVLTPSIVDRAPVVVAIGTEGTAPVLARQIKSRVETFLEPRLGVLAARVGALRDMAAFKFQARDRRELWRWVFEGPVRQGFAEGDEAAADELLTKTVCSGDVPSGATARISVLSVPQNDADLMTLKSVKRLQEADVIFVDQVVSQDILELARRDAERVVLENASGTENATAEILNVSNIGQSIVWLRRQTDEADRYMDALLRAGLDVEILSQGASGQLTSKGPQSPS